jgi:hypothetical protein
LFKKSFLPFEAALCMLIFGLHIDALFQSNTLAYYHKILSFSEKNYYTGPGLFTDSIAKSGSSEKTY